MDKLESEYMLWLYERYASFLYFAAGKFTESQSDREDLVHDALLRLMNNIPVLQKLEHKALAGYIYLTVRSVWLDRNTREQPLTEDILEHLAGQDPENGYLAKWDAATLQQKLPERDWFLLRCKYVIGCTDEEIGGILGCPPANVRVMLTRARRRAKAILEAMEENNNEPRN